MEKSAAVQPKAKDDVIKNKKKKEVREGSDVYMPPRMRRSLGQTPNAPKPSMTRHSCSGVTPRKRNSLENMATAIPQCSSEPKTSSRPTPTVVEAVPTTSEVVSALPFEGSPVIRPGKSKANNRTPKQRKSAANKKQENAHSAKSCVEVYVPPHLRRSIESLVSPQSRGVHSVDDSSPLKRSRKNLSKSPILPRKTVFPVVEKALSPPKVLPSPSVKNKKQEKACNIEPGEIIPSPVTAGLSSPSLSEPVAPSLPQRPLRASTISVKPLDNKSRRETTGTINYDKRRSAKQIIPTMEKLNDKKENGNVQIRAKTLLAPVSVWKKTEGTSPRTVARSGGCCSDEELDLDVVDEATQQVSSKEKYIDSHCHLDFLWTKLNGGSLETWMKIYPDAFPENFGGCIPNFIQPNLFVNEKEFEDTYDVDWIHKEVKNRYVLGASYGVHPHFSGGYNEKTAEGIRQMLVNRVDTKAVAVGECGFDFYKSNTSEDDQITSFRSQLQLAVEQQLPVIIHCRGSSKEPDYAEDLCLEIMIEVLPKDHFVHRHCFTQSWTTAQKWLKQFPNTFFGFTSGIAKQADLSAVMNLSLDRILLETDAPYFRPNSFVGKKSGPAYLSFPGMAVAVADVIAKARNKTVDEVISATRQNTMKCYNILL